MRTIILLLSLFIISCSNIFGQGHNHDAIEDGVFAYGNKEGGAFATVLLEKKSYKYKITKKVLTDLINAKGDRRMLAPTLKMSNAERYVAYAKPSEAIIGIEEKAYDICTTYGKDSLNALASLLAHELTHYYEKHNWTNHFVKQHDDMPLGDKLKSLDEKVKMETQADYLGGFLAYTAGYPIFELMPDFLDKVYKSYRFPPKMKGYPDLPERQQVATRALEKLRGLVLVFETANWLVALEQYEMAKKYYDYILLQGHYQSREIYNNLAVMATLVAMRYATEDEVRFVYPVELDPISRISQNATRGIEDRERIIAELLNLAIGNFKIALTLDEEYPTSLLNLGCAYTLSEKYFDAIYHTQKAIEIASKTKNEKVQADAENLMGIIYAKQDQRDKAISHFDKAIKLNSPLAAINKKLLDGDYSKGGDRKKMNTADEKIDEIHLDLLINKFTTGSEPIDQKIAISKEIILGLQNQKASRVLLHVESGEDIEYTFLHITNPEYNGQTARGIKIGATTESIIIAYGSPRKTMELSNGRYLIYDKQADKGLIFIMQKGALYAWCNYRN